MALINKIREKSGVAVAVIAISLILFIVGGDLLGPQMMFGGRDQNVGEIAGQKISYQEFNAKVDEARAAYEQQTGRGATEQDLIQLRDQAWNQFILDIAYRKEYDALGLAVTADELVDMVQGNYISPAIRQTFTNPQTGVFDKAQVISYLKNLKSLPPEQQRAWANFEQNLSADRLRTKYENLMRLSLYTTTAEAKKEYEAQNSRADVKFLFVPYYAVADTTIKVTDSQLQDYLDKHKDEYKGTNSRTIQYVTFSIASSKEDSSALYDQIKSLARGLATATNDSSFAQMNSDVRIPLYLTVGEMPEQLRAAVSTFTPGGVYGPYKEGNTYFIYKYGGTKRDTNFTTRASHILIRPTGQGDSAKAEARKRAEDVLRQIQGGASFEALARTNSADGSAQVGGDLGYFKNNGQMVKPFEQAIFGFNGTGLIPRVVETDFGFHIIKVTEPKTNTLYRVAGIGKELAASQSTRDEVYRRADEFAVNSKSKDDFDKNAKENKDLVVATAERVPESASSVNALGNARELVRWAFDDDTDVGDVSKAIEIGDQYVVAVVTGKANEDKVTVNDFRQELTAKVRNQLKAEQIIAKLNGSGSLEAVASKYGAGALVETVNDVNLATGFLKSAGIDPVALGRAFGQKVGQRSKPFAGENGVLMVETVKKTAAPAVADYALYKNMLQQNQGARTGFFINEAIRENAKVKDQRAKFY